MKLLLLSTYAFFMRIIIKSRYKLNLQPSKSFSKRWYDLINDLTCAVFSDFQLMNYGLHYSSFNDNDRHFSRIIDEDEKYPLQLYQYLIGDILHSKIHINSVLEVGCGRGGGSVYLI